MIDDQNPEAEEVAPEDPVETQREADLEAFDDPGMELGDDVGDSSHPEDLEDFDADFSSEDDIGFDENLDLEGDSESEVVGDSDPLEALADFDADFDGGFEDEDDGDSDSHEGLAGPESSDSGTDPEDSETEQPADAPTSDASKDFSHLSGVGEAGQGLKDSGVTADESQAVQKTPEQLGKTMADSGTTGGEDANETPSQNLPDNSAKSDDDPPYKAIRRK